MKFKKGSHVGVTISFVIFITFLMFFYTILHQKEVFFDSKEKIINNLKEAFIQNYTMTDVFVVTIFENESGYGCIEFDASEFGLYNFNAKVNGEEVGTYLDGNKLQITYSGSPTIFTVYFSPNIGGTKTRAPSTCIESEIKSIQFKRQISGDKIEDSINSYISNEQNLKEKLNIPSEKDFGIEFEREDGSVKKPNEENVLGEVYVEEIPIIYIDEYGNEKKGKLRLKIW